MWLNGMLTLNDHPKKTIVKARLVQNRVRSWMGNRGLNSERCKSIQVAAVQAVSLYGAELWWHGQNNQTQEVQKLLN